MRGNPIARAIALLFAMCLTGALVAAVLAPSKSALPAPPTTPPPPSDRVPTYLTFTLSAPATSLTFTEPSGTVHEVEPDGLEFEHEANLEVIDKKWNATISISWEEPTQHSFVRVDLEPDNLKSATLVLDFPGDASDFPIEANLNPAANTP